MFIFSDGASDKKLLVQRSNKCCQPSVVDVCPLNKDTETMVDALMQWFRLQDNHLECCTWKAGMYMYIILFV